MKRKYIYKLSILLLTIFIFTSCEKFLDVNTDPNRVTDVTLNTLLPVAIESTSTAHFRSARTVCQISQQIGSYFGYPEILSMSSVWSGIYLKSMNNLEIMIAKAEDNNSPYYAGIGRVLKAFNLGILTDNWEAVPYSEALLGSENFTPKYDAQLEIYSDIESLLNQALTELQSGESVFAPSSDDLAFQGDITKWIKLANTLKARYALHLTSKDATKAANDALAALANGFESSDDDFQLIYNSVIKNPWHVSVALANNTGNLSITQGGYLISLLVNDNDPRLAVIADAGETEPADIVGITAYDDNAPLSNTDFSEATWHSTEFAPILMITFSEAKFIEAEASFILGDKQAAYDAYIEGIVANIEKYGLDASDYIIGGSVAVDAGSLDLSDIIMEKYKALYLNQESWVDMRRFNYSSEIYKGLIEADPFGIGGSFQRVRYPDDEFNRNGDATTENNQELTVQMWRDL